jgi:hypothetical protein
MAGAPWSAEFGLNWNFSIFRRVLFYFLPFPHKSRRRIVHNTLFSRDILFYPRWHDFCYTVRGAGEGRRITHLEKENPLEPLPSLGQKPVRTSDKLLNLFQTKADIGGWRAENILSLNCISHHHFS